MARNRIRRYGTRAEVMNGTARMTQGRLTKADFIYNDKGYIVSKKKSVKMKGDDNPLKNKSTYKLKKVDLDLLEERLNLIERRNKFLI